MPVTIAVFEGGPVHGQTMAINGKPPFIVVPSRTKIMSFKEWSEGDPKHFSVNLVYHRCEQRRRYNGNYEVMITYRFGKPGDS